MTKQKDRRRRSIIKSLLWRFIATGITIAGVYFVFGDISLAFKFGIGINIIKMAAYYIHERIWNGIEWGKKLVD